MKRKIVKIDEELCNGCGQCIPNCQEGALQIIDDKARLISDLFCDGLGACIGHCPQGAITIEEREAEAYDERKVIAVIARQGENTIKAHLAHLKDHGELGYYNEALAWLDENHIVLQAKEPKEHHHHHHHGHSCPGSIPRSFEVEEKKIAVSEVPSQLRQWPVQLHLLNPHAGYFKNADVLLAADCVAFAMGNFHYDFMRGKTVAIACPKLDSNKESYVEKITAMIDKSEINSLTVVMMEVTCCGGLLQLAKMAMAQAKRSVPIKTVYVSIQGQVLKSE